MNTPWTLPLLALGASFCLSLLLTPLAQRFSVAVGLVDHPDNHRKLHRRPIALCGGLVLLTTLFLGFGGAFLFSPDLETHVQDSWFQAISLGIGSVAIVALGLMDDRFGLRGRQKLAGQILICLSIIAFGFSVESIQLFGVQLDLGLLAWPLTLLWLLLCINSINLIDGADGLCSTVGWIAFAAVAGISAFSSNWVESSIASAMAGSLLGFLLYNLPPAKVFLGDSGSMLIGLLLGVLTMRTWPVTSSAASITTPIVLMAIPLFDSFMAILRRKLTGRSVFTVDRGHLHHNLMRHGIRNRMLVGVITVLSLVTAGGAVLGVVLQSDLISLATMAFALGALVLSRLFGFAELQLLYKRLASLAASFFLSNNRPENGAQQHIVQLQGTRNWEIVWTTLVEFCEKHHMSRVSLDLNMPWLHEGFHASWHQSRMPEYSERWNVRLPLFHDGRVLGHLEFIGRHEDSEALFVLSQISEMLETLRLDLDRMIDEFATVKGSVIADDDSVDHDSVDHDSVDQTFPIPIASDTVASSAGV